MSLKDRINEEMKTAMKAKDQAALRALRAIKSAILLAETAEGRDAQAPLTEEEEMKLLTKQAKQRRDSLEQFRNAGREELAAKEAEELAVIETFLPKQLSAEEMEEEIKGIAHETGAAGMKDMGKVMAVASKRFAGRADGKLISELVKKTLNTLFPPL